MAFNNQEQIFLLKKGNTAVFKQLFQTYSRSLFFIAMNIVNNRQVAEDAVQETFVYIWTHRDQLNETFSLENYLIRSVKNYALNYLRHKSVETTHEEEIAREHDFWNLTEEDMTHKIRQIREVIDSLPKQCQKIFLMTVLEEKSYSETAEELNISVNTVKTQVKIAYKKIKAEVGKNTDTLTILISCLFLN